jgi:hypothetical protein
VRQTTSSNHARVFPAGSLPGIKVATMNMKLLVVGYQSIEVLRLFTRKQGERQIYE